MISVGQVRVWEHLPDNDKSKYILILSLDSVTGAAIVKYLHNGGSIKYETNVVDSLTKEM
jgi:hypothetical protein